MPLPCARRPGGFHVERGGRIGATERLAGRLDRAHIDKHACLAGLDHARDRRLGRHAGLDLILLHGRDEGATGADWNRHDVAGLQAGLRGHEEGQEVGGRAETGDAEGLTFEVGWRFDVRILARNHLDFARRLAELDDGFDEFAFGLQVHAMVVEADHALDGAGQKLVFGIDAGSFVQEFDVETLVLEISERFGKLGGQIDLLFIAADHDGDLIGRMCGAGRERCCGEKRRKSDGVKKAA